MTRLGMLFGDRARGELPQAEFDLQHAKECLEHLRKLLEQGKLVGADTRRLLQTMGQTCELQARHVATLKQEIEEGL